MKKIVIPAILIATVLVAGMFAFMPVEKASTVHSSLAKKGSASFSSTVNSALGTVNVIADLGAGQVASFTVTRNISTALTGGDLAANCIDANGNSAAVATAATGTGITTAHCVGRGVTATVGTGALTGGAAVVSAVGTIGN